MNSGLTEKSVIITGAAGSLGRAIADRFVNEGVRAIALVDLDPIAVSAMATSMERAGLDVVAVALDVTDHDAVLEQYATLATRFGGIDVAINNAGIVAPSARIHHVKPEDFRHVLEVNLMGIFNCLKAAIIEMRAAGSGGAIINTASVAGTTTWTHSSPYGASKAAVIQLTKLAAAEYASDRIRVNCVSPATFVTRFHDDLPDGALDALLERHPLQRFGTTDEIAAAYVYLASENATWITGTSLVIDGGLSIA